MYCSFCFVFFFVRFSFVRYCAALCNGRRSRSTNDRIVSASHIAVVSRVGSVPYTATGYPYRINIGLPWNTWLEKFCRTRFTNVSTSASPVLEYDWEQRFTTSVGFGLYNNYNRKWFSVAHKLHYILEFPRFPPFITADIWLWGCYYWLSRKIRPPSCKTVSLHQ